jgi:hypothetical protein
VHARGSRESRAASLERSEPDQRVEPADTGRGRLPVGLEAIGAVSEGALVAAPYRRLTRQPLWRRESRRRSRYMMGGGDGEGERCE